MFLGDNRGVRVLVVEDDRKLARLIARVLSGEGIDVDLAHDGDEGTEHALRGTYDVIVVDWMLPGRGWTMVRHCRRYTLAIR